MLGYKSNAKDSADKYLRTTEGIADYMGRKNGKDMQMLVQNHTTEKNITGPRAPRKKDATPGLLEKYNTELNNYHKNKKEYEDHKLKIFAVILGQCTPMVRSKLESNNSFSTLEKDNNVVGLLTELRKMAFMISGESDLF